MLTKITSDFIDANTFVHKDRSDDATYDSQGNYSPAISGNKKFLNNVEIDGTLTVNGDTNWNFTTTGAVTSSSSGSFNQINVAHTGWFEAIRVSSLSGIILPSSVFYFNSGGSTTNVDVGSLINKADYASGSVKSGSLNYIFLSKDASVSELSLLSRSGLGTLDVQEITSKAGCAYNDGRFRSTGLHISSSGHIQNIIDAHNDSGDLSNKGYVFSVAKYAKLLGETNNPGLEGCCNSNFQEIFRIDSLGNVAITGSAYIMSGLHLSGNLDMTGDILNVNDLTVTGTLTLDNDLTVNNLIASTVKATTWLSGLMITGGNAIIRGNLTGQNIYAEQNITGQTITGYDGKFGHDFLVWGELSGASITGDLAKIHKFSGHDISGYTGSFNAIWSKSGQFTEKLTISGNSVITGADNYEYVVRCADGGLWSIGKSAVAPNDAYGWEWSNADYWDTTLQRNNFGFIKWDMGGSTHSNFTTGQITAENMSGVTYLNFSPPKTGLYLIDYSAYFTGTVNADTRARFSLLSLRTILQMRPSGEDYLNAKETGVKSTWIIHSGDIKYPYYSTAWSGAILPIKIVAPVFITGNVTINVGYSEQQTYDSFCGWGDCYVRENCLTLRYAPTANAFTYPGLIPSKGTGV